MSESRGRVPPDRPNNKLTSTADKYIITYAAVSGNIADLPPNP